MRTIWKFPVVISDGFAIRMPVGAEILSFDILAGQPNIWVLVDPDASVEPRFFRVVGTGHSLHADGLDYIGTVLDDVFVWHLFEEKQVG